MRRKNERIREKKIKRERDDGGERETKELERRREKARQ